MRAVWRCSTQGSGALCATANGITGMEMLCADSLATSERSRLENVKCFFPLFLRDNYVGTLTKASLKPGKNYFSSQIKSRSIYLFFNEYLSNCCCTLCVCVQMLLIIVICVLSIKKRVKKENHAIMRS